MNSKYTYLDQFLEMLIGERGVSLNTLVAYRYDIIEFLETANCEVKTVKEKNIQQYLSILHDKNLKPQSIARKLSALRQFYGFLCSENICEENPTYQIPTPKTGRGLPKILREEEIHKLIEAVKFWPKIERLRLLLILELFYATGARVSELISLKLSSFSQEFKAVLLRGKGDKERLVPLNETAIEVLQQYLVSRNLYFPGAKNKKVTASPWLFPSNSKTGHITRQRIGQLIKNLAIKANIDENKVSPHVLRHAFASHLLDHGADLLAVQELLGHADVGTTQIYTHVLSEKLIKVVKEKHPLGRVIK